MKIIFYEDLFSAGIISIFYLLLIVLFILNSAKIIEVYLLCKDHI